MSRQPAGPFHPSAAAVEAALRAAGCVFAEDEARLLLATARTPEQLRLMVEQRAEGTPLEHLLGWVDFCGLRISLDSGVFVPRRRSAFLVQRAAAAAGAHPVLVDLCCGSGAVGAAIAAAVGAVELYASDLDPVAVRCARRNLASIGTVVQGDLFAPLPVTLRGRVDLVVAVAPYVPTDAIRLMPPEARLHESRAALDGGADGLGVYRRMVADAPDWLAPGGHLLIEVAAHQADAAAAVLAEHGLAAEVATFEDLDSTVVIGRSPRASTPTGLGRTDGLATQ